MDHLYFEWEGGLKSKVRKRADGLRLVLQCNTAPDLGSFQGIERLECLVGEALVVEWPPALAWIQLWRIGRQEEQMDALGHYELVAGMPARLIKDHQHPLDGT